MNRNIVLSLTLLWCGALVAMEGVQTAPAALALPNLDNIGNFDQWLLEDESVKDDGDRSFDGMFRHIEKLNSKCEEYDRALKIELDNIVQVRSQLRNPKVIRNSEIGLRDRTLVHKIIAKKSEAVAKGLIRRNALVDLMAERIMEYGNSLPKHGWLSGIMFWFKTNDIRNRNMARRYTAVYNLIPELNDCPDLPTVPILSNYPVLTGDISHAYLYANPMLAGQRWIKWDKEESIKEYILKVFSHHIPRMVLTLDTMTADQVNFLFNLAVSMRIAICVREKQDNNTLEGAKAFFKKYLAALTTIESQDSLSEDLKSRFVEAAEDLDAIRFDEALSKFIMPNERLRNLRLLLNPSQPQD